MKDTTRDRIQTSLGPDMVDDIKMAIACNDTYDAILLIIANHDFVTFNHGWHSGYNAKPEDLCL